MAGQAKTTHLVDNDFLIKLARWDLLDEFVTSFGISASDIRAIPSLRGRLVTNGSANTSLCGNAAAAFRLQKFLSKASAPIPVDNSFVVAAFGISGLDAGEVTLLGALCGGGGTYFYTGDKNAIRALSGLNGSQFEPKYKGKIICLEQALQFMINQLGFGNIRDKLCSDLDTDPGIANLLVGGAQTSEKTFSAGLLGQINSLQSQCGNLLRIT